MLTVFRNHASAICAFALVGMILFAGAFFGCISGEQKEQINAKIIELIETSGQDAAVEYIDKLVEDGRLGAKNAEDIKAVIPQGVEKVKEILEANK